MRQGLNRTAEETNHSSETVVSLQQEETPMRTRYVRPLTANERAALEHLYRYGKSHFERRRAQFILLSAAGHHLQQAASLVGMCRKTAGHTLRTFETEGEPGLHEPKRSGRRSRASGTVRQELDAALQRSPRELGLPTNNWTGPVLSRHLQER
jgi:transposase